MGRNRSTQRHDGNPEQEAQYGTVPGEPNRDPRESPAVEAESDTDNEDHTDRGG
jgi:hypothetical protein